MESIIGPQTPLQGGEGWPDQMVRAGIGDNSAAAISPASAGRGGGARVRRGGDSACVAAPRAARDARGAGAASHPPRERRKARGERATPRSVPELAKGERFAVKPFHLTHCRRRDAASTTHPDSAARQAPPDFLQSAILEPGGRRRGAGSRLVGELGGAWSWARAVGASTGKRWPRYPVRMRPDECATRPTPPGALLSPFMYPRAPGPCSPAEPGARRGAQAEVAALAASAAGRHGDGGPRVPMRRRRARPVCAKRHPSALSLLACKYVAGQRRWHRRRGGPAAGGARRVEPQAIHCVAAPARGRAPPFARFS